MPPSWSAFAHRPFRPVTARPIEGSPWTHRRRTSSSHDRRIWTCPHRVAVIMPAYHPIWDSDQEPDRGNLGINRDLLRAFAAPWTPRTTYVRLNRSLARGLLVGAVTAVVQPDPPAQGRRIPTPLGILERHPPEVDHGPQNQQSVLACHVERRDPRRSKVLVVPPADADGPLVPQLQRGRPAHPLTDEAIQAQLNSGTPRLAQLPPQPDQPVGRAPTHRPSRRTHPPAARATLRDPVRNRPLRSRAGTIDVPSSVCLLSWTNTLVSSVNR